MFFLYAIIPLEALKPQVGLIHRTLKLEYEYMHPVIGYLGYHTSLIYNLRFFGNYNKGYKENNIREYTRDESNDPVWQMVKILFPSTGGALTTTSTADSNIGKNLGSGKEIARFIKLAHYYRQSHNHAALRGIKKIKNQDPKPPRDLWETIEKAIKQEVELGYPKYTVEQIWLTFLWVHFNDRKALDEFYQELGDEFCTDQNSELQSVIDYTTELGLRKGLTSYNQAIVQPVNNARCQAYDRTSQKLLSNTFADCVETAIRHIVTLLIYDPSKQKYRETGNTQIDDFFQNLSNPNSGEESVRSDWNKCVADLNIEERDNLPHVLYVRDGKNEISSHLLNVANVLIRSFKITSPEIIKLFTEVNESTLPVLFREIFKIIHMNKEDEIEVTVTDIKKINERFYGVLSVKIKIGSNEITFQYKSTSGHGEINDIEDSYLQNISNQQIPLEDRLLKDQLQLVALLEERARRTLPLNLFYQLMGRPLTDNDAYIKFIKSLFKENNTPSLYLKPLEHVLNAVSYDDDYTVSMLSVAINSKNLTPECQKIIHQNVKGIQVEQDFDVSQYTALEKLIIEKPWDEDQSEEKSIIFKANDRLKELSIRLNKIDTLDVSALVHLEKLSLLGGLNREDKITIKTIALGANSAIKELTINKNSVIEVLDLREAQNLETLKIGGEIKSIILGNNFHLKEVIIDTYSTIGLFDLSSVESLEKLSIPSGIQMKINALILGANPHLKELDISATQNLEELTIRSRTQIDSLVLGDLSGIKKLTISSSSMKGLIDLSHAQNLKEIYFDETPNMQLVFGNNPLLENINLEEIGEIYKRDPLNLDALSNKSIDVNVKDEAIRRKEKLINYLNEHPMPNE